MKNLIFLLAVVFLQYNKPPLDEENLAIKKENLSLYNNLLLEIGSEKTYKDEVANFKKDDKSTGGITFTGSSTIENWKTLSQDFPTYHVRNHGLGGSNLGHIIAHGEDLIFFNRPQIVVLYIGDNDASALSVETFERYMDCFVQNFKHRLPRAYLVFLTVKPSPVRSDKFPYYRKVNKYLDSLALTSDRLYCVDIWTPLEQGNTPSYFIPDMLHLNRKGYELIVDKLSPVLDSIMATTIETDPDF